MRLKLDALKGFEGDLRTLPTRTLQEKALLLLSLIAGGEMRGQALDKRVGTGDLSDCLKVYFDEDGETGRPKYRLVYRPLPDGVSAVTVQAVAVGERFKLDAYVRALRNLGR